MATKKKATVPGLVSTVDDPQKMKGLTKADHLRKYVGDRLAVICARYAYRGDLSAVGDDYIVIANATSVEDAGTASAKAPRSEDAINSSIMISLDAVELAFQPTWCFAPLPNEK